MAGKSVAKKGDVKPDAGTKMYSDATTGTWSPGTISETSYSNLKTDGAEVVYEATCTFTFVNGKKPVPGGTQPVPGSSDVKLSAKTKLLQNGQSKVLVDGDEHKDDYGNKLYVTASNKLKTG